MFGNKFDQYRPEVCPEITFIGHVALYLFQRFFEHIFEHMLGLYRKTEKCRSEDYEGVLLASAKLSKYDFNDNGFSDKDPQ